MTGMKLLTPKQVADLTGFKPRTITRWCRDGELEGAVKVGRVWRIPYNGRDDLVSRLHKIAGKLHA